MKVGDRINITRTGTVTAVYKDTSTVEYTGSSGADGCVTLPGDEVTVLEPEYEIGAVYLSVTGVFYQRLEGAWRGFDGGHVAHDVPARPLVKLVREDGE